MAAPAAEQALVDVAVALCREAGAMATEEFSSTLRPAEVKPDGSVVTDVDRRIEALLVERILGAFPDDGVLGEEHGERIGTSGRRWIVDPIDGTEAFVHGVAEFCSMLAVEDDHGVLIGVIDIPVLGETVWAGRGAGSFLNGRPIRMAESSSLDGVYVATSDLDDWPDPVLRAARAAGLRLRTWGGGYGVGLAVSGRVDAFVDYNLDVWDVAPAVVLATEAGGICSALDGTTRLDGGTCLVSPTALHAALLGVFGDVGP